MSEEKEVVDVPLVESKEEIENNVKESPEEKASDESSILHDNCDEELDGMASEEKPLLPDESKETANASEDIVEIRKPMKGDWQFIFLTIPMFMGYASLFSMQQYLKKQLFVTDDQATTYSMAYSLLYWGNLIFRAAHNYVWIFCNAYWRVIISFISMVIAQILLIITMSISWSPLKNNLCIAFFIYAFGGIGIGTFEANILNVANGVSARAHSLAVIGIPCGVNIVTIGAYLLIAAAGEAIGYPMACIVVYSIILAFMVYGFVIMLVFVPNHETPESKLQRSIKYLPEAFCHWKEWGWKVFPNAICMMFNMFTVSAFSPGMILYEFDDSIPIKFCGLEINRGTFQIIFGCFTFIGDFFSRIAFKKVKHIFPAYFLLFNALGVGLVFTGIPEAIVFVSLLVMWGNGCLYIQSSNWIKKITEGTNYNLAAYSFWLFVGDMGSVIASMCLQDLVKGVCVNLKTPSYNPCPYYVG